MGGQDNILTKVVGANVTAQPPAVSIIIPNYNTAKYISETLDSVFEQTFTDFEVIVINDAAPDTEELKTVLGPYLSRITFIDKSINEGTSATRNAAAAHARAPVLAFLDADDIWRPTFLEELHGFMLDHEYEMAYTDAEMFGLIHLAGKDFLPYNPPQGDVTRSMLIEGKCHILPSGTLIRKDVFDAVGGFDPGVTRTEDFDLWMRMFFRGTRVGYLRKLLFKFRLRPESGSGDSLQRIERCINIWHTLRKKVDFTDDENKIIDRHIAVEEAALLRARGRLALTQRDWPAARSAFRKAKSMADELGLPLRHRLKMSAVLLLLTLSPSLLLKLFRNVRSEEIEYMPTAVSN